MNLHVSLPHLPQFVMRTSLCHLAYKAFLADHTCLQRHRSLQHVLAAVSSTSSSPSSPLATYPFSFLSVSPLEGKLPCGWDFTLVLFTTESTGLRAWLPGGSQTAHICAVNKGSSLCCLRGTSRVFCLFFLPKVLFSCKFCTVNMCYSHSQGYINVI